MKIREHTCFEPDQSGDGSEPCVSDGVFCKKCKMEMCTWHFDDEGYCEQCYNHQDEPCECHACIMMMDEKQ